MRKCNCECCRKNRQNRVRRNGINPTGCMQSCSNLIDKTEQIIAATEFKTKKLVKSLDCATYNLDKVNLAQPIKELENSQTSLVDLKEDLDAISKTLKTLSNFLDEVEVPNLECPISMLSNSATYVDNGMEDTTKALEYARFIDDKLIPKLKCSFEKTVECLEDRHTREGFNLLDDIDDFCN